MRGESLGNLHGLAIESKGLIIPEVIKCSCGIVDLRLPPGRTRVIFLAGVGSSENLVNVVDGFIKQAGVELIGPGLDEAPMAYKDIHQVMEHQKDLVEVLGTFNAEGCKDVRG